MSKLIVRLVHQVQRTAQVIDGWIVASKLVVNLTEQGRDAGEMRHIARISLLSLFCKTQCFRQIA